MNVYFDILLQTLLSGVLIGLIYALVAAGLTMIFGVMDIVNFAHGEFLMLGMYSSFWGFSLWALDPMFTLPFTALMLFALGATIYHVVIRRIIRAPMLSQIFTTFGLMILFRGVAQFLWKPDFRTIEHSIVQGKVAFAGLQFGLPQLMAAAGVTQKRFLKGHWVVECQDPVEVFDHVIPSILCDLRHVSIQLT